VVGPPIPAGARNRDMVARFELMQRHIHGLRVNFQEFRYPPLPDLHGGPLVRIPSQHSVNTAGSDRQPVVEKNRIRRARVIFRIALFGFSVHFLSGFSVHVIETIYTARFPRLRQCSQSNPFRHRSADDPSTPKRRAGVSRKKRAKPPA
jgi:hypothetical protein